MSKEKQKSNLLPHFTHIFDDAKASINNRFSLMYDRGCDDVDDNSDEVDTDVDIDVDADVDADDDCAIDETNM